MKPIIPRRTAAKAHDVDESGDLVLLDPSGAQLVVVNPVGAAVYELIDGQRDLDAMAAFIAAQMGVTPELARSDVAAFLNVLAVHGLVAFDELS